MAKKYWLIKSEPFKYSWKQFLQDGSTFWDGVRNYQARNNLKAMQKGDQAFFYHSNEGLEIVGIAEVIKEAYQDPSTTDEKWVAVDFKPIQTLDCPVTLTAIKNEKILENMVLLKQSRLSVSSVTQKEFEYIMQMSLKQ